MPSLITENANTILERTMGQLIANTQITRLTPGAKARTLLGIISSEIERLENILSANLVLSLVNGAQGIYLDFLGELVGQERNQRASANTTSSSETIRIYVDPGLTFGDLNSQRNIRVPSGTVISSADNQFRFALRGDAVLNIGDSEQFVSARSLTIGSQGNISRGALTRINFEDYTTAPSPALKVENLSSIENGAEADADALYRHKITSAFLSAEAGNLTAIRMGLIGLEAVADIQVMPLARGVGTADIIIETTSGEVTNTTVESAERIIDIVSSVGTDIKIRKPVLIGLELGLNVKYARGITSLDKRQVAQLIRNTVASIVSEVPMGGSLDIASTGRAIFRASDKIIEIGLPGEPLTDIILWRDSVLSRARSPLLLYNNSTINLSVDEKLILEGKQEEAIRITEK